MSSYRKHRSRKSIYHPGISLNHPITYNQKKGMIIQRDTSLPQPGHVYSRKELEKMYKTLFNFRMIPKPFITVVSVADTATSANQLNEFLLSYNELKADIASGLGISVQQIYAFELQSIAVRVLNGNFPKVSYRWVVGEGAFDVSSGTNSLSNNFQYNVKLGTPIVYQNQNYPEYINIVCPQVKNSTSSPSTVSVQWDQVFQQTSTSTHHEVYDLWQEGERDFPWAKYDSRITNPIDVYTELSIDMTGNSTNGNLMLGYMIVYEQ